MNSRSKGNRNERVAAKLVSEWTGRKFERTPSSGGLQWKASFSKGDIVCTKEGHFFPFCLEVKAHREIDFSHLLNPKIKNVKIMEFWAQCRRDAKKCGKVPMLLMRYNGLPSEFFFLALPTSFEAKIIGFPRLDLPYFLRYKSKYNSDNITIFRSPDFFQLPYKDIKQLAKTYLNGQKEKNTR